MYEAEIACFGFVVPGCEAAGAFEFIEGAFDLISQSVDMVVNRDLDFTPLPCGNDREAAATFHVVSNTISVISLIGDQNFRLRTIRLHNQVVASIIGNFPACNFRCYGEPFGVCAEVNLCRKATF